MRKDNKNLTSGFTLIELLVVVAIIGMLASVVLAQLLKAGDKGADAAVKANVDSVRTQAQAYYYANTQSFNSGANVASAACPSNATTNMLADTVLKAALAEANKQAGGTVPTNGGGANTYTATRCGISPKSFAIVVNLSASDGGAWCVDSSGTSKRTTNLATVAGSIAGAGTTASPYVCGT